MLAEFGSGQVFWSLLWFFLFFLWIWLAITIFSDIFRSDDLSGWGKALWTIFVIFLPYLGIFVYLIVAARRWASTPCQEAQRRDAMFRGYVQEVVTSTPSDVDQLEKLATLRDQGVIDEEEFARMKARVTGAVVELSAVDSAALTGRLERGDPPSPHAATTTTMPLTPPPTSKGAGARRSGAGGVRRRPRRVLRREPPVHRGRRPLRRGVQRLGGNGRRRADCRRRPRGATRSRSDEHRGRPGRPRVARRCAGGPGRSAGGVPRRGGTADEHDGARSCRR